MGDEREFADKVQNFDVSYDDPVPVARQAIQLVSVPPLESFEESELYGMEGKELLQYFVRRFQETFGFAYVVEWVKEIAVMKSFKRRFGPESGPMIKLLFDKYGGKWNGKPVSVTTFSKGSKWIQDMLNTEIQQSRATLRRVASKQGEMLDSS